MHALVTADTIGGVWTYARELVTGLIKRGLKVTLVSFGEIPSHDQTEWMDALPGLNFRPTAFRLEWMQEAEEDLYASSEYLLSLIREVKPDILHLNQYCCAGTATLLLPASLMRPRSWRQAAGCWMRCARSTRSRRLAESSTTGAIRGSSTRT